MKEGSRIWECDVCGKMDSWGPTWAAYGSIKSMENCGREGMFIVCSDECKEKAGPHPKIEDCSMFPFREKKPRICKSCGHLI